MADVRDRWRRAHRRRARGQIAELSRRAFGDNFRNFDPAAARIVLLDGLEHRAAQPTRSACAAGRDATSSSSASRSASAPVSSASTPPASTSTAPHRGADEDLGSRRAGLAARTDPRRARRRRCRSLRTSRGAADCSLPGHPEVFVVGDLMALNGLPGLAEVAMQSGHHAARTIVRRLRGRTPKPFRYRDLGTMATISRFRAVASVGRLQLCGPIAWVLWLEVHLAFLNGFENRRGGGRQLDCRVRRTRPAPAHDHRAAGVRTCTRPRIDRRANHFARWLREGGPKMRNHRLADTGSEQHGATKLALGAMLVPVFFVIMFATCIIGTYNQPHPNGIKVGVVGPDALTAPLRARHTEHRDHVHRQHAPVRRRRRRSHGRCHGRQPAFGVLLEGCPARVGIVARADPTDDFPKGVLAAALCREAAARCWYRFLPVAASRPIDAIRPCLAPLEYASSQGTPPLSVEIRASRKAVRDMVVRTAGHGRLAGNCDTLPLKPSAQPVTRSDLHDLAALGGTRTPNLLIRRKQFIVRDRSSRTPQCSRPAILPDRVRDVA